jgi:hypothetical protein
VQDNAYLNTSHLLMAACILFIYFKIVLDLYIRRLLSDAHFAPRFLDLFIFCVEPLGKTSKDSLINISG